MDEDEPRAHLGYYPPDVRVVKLEVYGGGYGAGRGHGQEALDEFRHPRQHQAYAVAFFKAHALEGAGYFADYLPELAVPYRLAMIYNRGLFGKEYRICPEHLHKRHQYAPTFLKTTLRVFSSIFRSSHKDWF